MVSLVVWIWQYQEPETNKCREPRRQKKSNQFRLNFLPCQKHISLFPNAHSIFPSSSFAKQLKKKIWVSQKVLQLLHSFIQNVHLFLRWNKLDLHLVFVKYFDILKVFKGLEILLLGYTASSSSWTLIGQSHLFVVLSSSRHWSSDQTWLNSGIHQDCHGCQLMFLLSILTNTR